MISLAEKIEASKRCCLKVKDYIAEKRREFNNKLFDSEWKVFVIKRDAETGKFVGKVACCALTPV